jgi:mono/diheme cytochrome c family protein
MPWSRVILLAILSAAPFAAAAAPNESPRPPIQLPDFDVKPKIQPSRGMELQLPRGQLLYENHCGSCHTSQLHIRRHRRAKSAADVRQWVRRWARELRLEWSADEVDDVAQYLNGRYYRFPATTK